MNQNVWRTRIVTAAAVAAAVWLGGHIAAGELFWPVFVCGAIGTVALSQMQPVPVGTAILGCVAMGYIVGNRGFAQMSIAEGIPLLPAEFTLVVAGGIMVAQSAMNKDFPVRRDLMNAALILWIALSSVRLIPDIKSYGVMALRDYATVYYAAFFFLAQRAGSTDLERRFLMRCLMVGFTALLVVYPFYVKFPDFFMGHLLLRGTPIIYFKDDLLGTFLAAGSVFAFAQFDRSKSRLALVLSLAMAAATMTTNNRASMLGLMIPAVFVALGGRPRFLVYLCCTAVVGALALFLEAEIRDQRLENTPLYDMYERVESLADPFGTGNYSGEVTSNKGDNNAFRSTWWRIIIGETVRINPWLGTGWGNDLAEPFLRAYYPEGGEDFGVRSPHNIFVTIFARTGLLGLVPFLGFVGVFLIRTWRAIRSNLESTGMWCAALTILTSATFGVVLEGPMGAVLFWTVLGLACCKYPQKALSDPALPDKRCSLTASGEWHVANGASLGSESAAR